MEGMARLQERTQIRTQAALDWKQGLFWKMSKRAWEDHLETMCRDVVPLKQIPYDQATAPPIIVNIVSTAILLPQRPDLPAEKRYKLPLDAISMRLGCSQYAPVLFAANIIKFTDSTTNATALVFGSGKIVVVSGLSVNHTRYISQLIRVVIEQVSCMMISEQDGKSVVKGSLLGRTVFQQCNIHNIVAHGDLGCRIDLQAMCDEAPACCKWYPDLFPGLKCKIWLTQEHRCVCKSSSGKHRTPATPTQQQQDDDVSIVIGKQNKCTCAVKVLIFDSGCIVVTGGRHVRDVNSVFFRIKHLAPQFKSGTGDALIPKEDRFYQRLSAMMVPTGQTLKQVKQMARPELKPTEAIASVLAGVSAVPAMAQINDAKKARMSGGTPLMRMAEAGRVNDVRMTLEMDKQQAQERDSEGRTTMDRLKLIPLQERTMQHKQIMDLLIVYCDVTKQPKRS